MIKGLLFDMDGVLIDSESYYTRGTIDWIRKLNIKINDEDIYPIIGKTMDYTYKYLSKLTGLTYNECVKYNEDYFYNTNPLDYSKIIFPDIRSNLYNLKKESYKLALCSMSSEKDVSNCLKELDLYKIFDYVVSCEDCKPKPSGDIYLKALNKLNISSNEALVIEDSYEGINAGKNAKIKVVARKDYRFNINQSDADYFIDDLNDLNRLLGEINE